MLIASIATSTFPAALPHSAEPRSKVVLSSTAWTAIAGVVCMTLSQSSVFSFLERVGVTRGFGPDRVNMLLAAIGLINLAPALLAGLLQHRLSPQRVAVGAALVQMTLGITITVSSTFIPYAAAASFYAFVLIFAHTFIFGLLARLDSSGRAVSLTPAMLMAGSALGPLFAGTVAQRVGFEGLAIVVMLIGTAATVCFVRVARNLDRIPEQSSASIARAS